MSKFGYVYFIECQHGDSFAVKIGWSIYPHARLASLQTGNPCQMWIQKLIRVPLGSPLAGTGTRSLESQLHRRFAEWQIGPEWFITSIPIREYMNTALPECA